MKHTPAHGGYLLALFVLAQDGMPEEREQIAGDHTDTEEAGIGFELSAGHALHAKADLKLHHAVFGKPLRVADTR